MTRKELIAKYKKRITDLQSQVFHKMPEAMYHGIRQEQDAFRLVIQDLEQITEEGEEK